MILDAEFVAKPLRSGTVHLAVTWPIPRHLKHLGTTRFGRIRQLTQPIFKQRLASKAPASLTVKVAVAILCPLELALETKHFAAAALSSAA